MLKVEPRIRDKELPEKSIMVGDDYAASVHRIIAAGGTERFIPEAPVKTAPEPVVDDKGHTNWVSHYLPRPQLFEMKDGRVITVVSTTGKKVARIDVQPPRETND